MASLRARLIVGVVAVAAVGLLLLGGITYFAQRSFQYNRVDAQTRNAVFLVGPALLGNDRPDGDGEPPGGGPDGERHHGGELPPAGVYGQIRATAGGGVLKSGFVGPTPTPKPSPPVIPTDLAVGRLTTVPSKSDSGLRYRVLAESSPRGFQSTTTIAAVPLREVDQTLHRLLLVELLVVGAVLLALGVTAAFVVRLGLRPLDRIGRSAGAIAAGDLSHRVAPATPRTEVGRLGISLNAMLDRLEEAFAERRASEDRLRRFIADASHELRTPLQSIRGYAELYRIGAARQPDETARAMGRIEDEATRMGTLVEDLLTLARLDEIRDRASKSVDLGELAADVAADAQATAPDRAITVDVQEPVTVAGDPDGLHQVLANLLRNALVHTPAGTAVEITVCRRAGEAWLEVRDHGPGLPTDDSDALFERFWRAERGRERGKAGAGLGLAIVARIVSAHHGHVQAANAPGGGARFLVRLPARDATSAPAAE